MKKDSKRIRVEANKGADFLVIEDKGDGTVYLCSGSCCVVSIRAVVPVEFLTRMIQDVLLEHDNDVLRVIDGFDWSEDYKDELKSKVVKIQPLKEDGGSETEE